MLSFDNFNLQTGVDSFEFLDLLTQSIGQQAPVLLHERFRRNGCWCARPKTCDGYRLKQILGRRRLLHENDSGRIHKWPGVFSTIGPAANDHRCICDAWRLAKRLNEFESI